MIFKVLIIAAIIFYIRLLIKKTSEQETNIKSPKNKDDSIEADYEVLD